MEKCVECGAAMSNTIEHVDLPYLSLPGVVLVGIEARRCTQCDTVEYVIPRIEDLNRSIAQALVKKPTRLAGPEVRFLRKYLGWSGRDFASRIGVAPETVSRWENRAMTIGETPDKLLRMFVVHERPVEDYALEQFEQLAKAEGEPLTLRFDAAHPWRNLAA